MPFKVVVDREACIGCGAAPSICPQVFELEEDSGRNKVSSEYSVSVDSKESIGEVPDELYECIKLAQESCPVNAITVEEL